jgi:hypothetical protein
MLGQLTPGVSQHRLHWALNLGLEQEVKQWLLAHTSALSPGERGKLRFRLAQKLCKANPHLELIEAARLDHIYAQLNNLPPGAWLRIRLIGGLGDHLQALSLIHSWCLSTGRGVQVESTPQRVNQLQRLLASHPLMTLVASTRPAVDHPLNSLGFEALMQHGQPELAHSAWLQEQGSLQPATARVVACWRAQGNLDRFSAHSRSVTFATVQGFWRRLRSHRPDLTLIDLTQWKPFELAALKQFGVELHDPSQDDVAALVDLVAGATVISIDTALAHLCACMGQPAWVLLPLFADERWLSLRHERHCYGQVLRFAQQHRYGCWQAPLQTVLNAVLSC